MKADTVTLRVPLAWAGRVESETVRAWLKRWFERPEELPEDPGAGEGYLRLSLPRRVVQTFAAALDEEPSAALRRLIRARQSFPAASPAKRLPAVMPSPSGLVRSSNRGASVAVEAMDAPAVVLQPALGTAVAGAELMACLRCHDLTLHRRRNGAWCCEVCQVRDRSWRVRQACWPDAPEVQTCSPLAEPWRTAETAPHLGRFWLWLVVAAVLLWWLKPWRWLKQPSSVSYSASAKLMEAFKEWTPWLKP